VSDISIVAATKSGEMRGRERKRKLVADRVGD
jgi:hypothetical protein